ncbi:hypothetical protein MGU_11005 [Metarhizium guizhouense ARSEF 977]|uniref:Uncharacterized protein n=1 Tax=Metarhizium guizhouense (strain ARSEF 977) TaxID=1276136 RepID=A0A0B4GPI1_METGA|nr:hypothetical protein MGU_11005 [Metarhizium guizhouense ARSEF 977]
MFLFSHSLDGLCGGFNEEVVHVGMSGYAFVQEQIVKTGYVRGLQRSRFGSFGVACQCVKGQFSDGELEGRCLLEERAGVLK